MESFDLPTSQSTEFIYDNSLLWADSFLNWFSSLKIPMFESKLKIGNFDYFHFSSLIADHPSKKVISGFGSHQNRKLAAIKCAAETLERIEMLAYFSKNINGIPLNLQTSNGWAVHRSKKLACDKALAEATERHLLLKSFFLHRWNGFRLVQKIESSDVTLYLTLGKYTLNNQVSILVAAESKKFNGVSFGYGLGSLSEIGSSVFWTSAIFEAVDKILLSDTTQKSPKPNDNWIRSEIFKQLNTPFDFSVFSENSDSGFHVNHEQGIASVEYIAINLAEKNNLNFSLFVAYAKSDDLIPLFSKKFLNMKALNYLSPILEKHKIFEIPESNPIL